MFYDDEKRVTEREDMTAASAGAADDDEPDSESLLSLESDELLSLELEPLELLLALRRPAPPPSSLPPPPCDDRDLSPATTTATLGKTDVQ